MPMADIAILSLIVFAFVAFAAVLAWGDHQTREIAKASRARALAARAAPAPERKPIAEGRLRVVERKTKPERSPVHRLT